MMKTWLKRIASAVCAAAMCAAMLPVTAFAAEMPTITDFAVERVTNKPNDAIFVAFDLDGVTYSTDPINLDDGEEVTLLYKVTVKGEPNDEAVTPYFSVDIGDATLVGKTAAAPMQTGTTVIGDVPRDMASTYFYVSKTFSATDVQDDQLTFAATIEAYDGSTVVDESVNTTCSVGAPATAPGTTDPDEKPEEPGEKISKPGLNKWIIAGDEKLESDTAAAGTDVTFELESNVPDNLRNYIVVDEPTTKAASSYKLVFADTLDAAFDDPKNFVIKIGDTMLTDGQYNLDLSNTHEFSITLDLVKLYEAGIIKSNDIANATAITVTYAATLKADTTAGIYTNKAQVGYPEGSSSMDTVTVKTYAIRVFKYDQVTNEGLKGAVFGLYQKDSDGNLINNHGTLTTDAEGYIRVDGLDAGTYYLKEAAAPDGYVCSETELEIEVNDEAAGVDYIVDASFANAAIPETGGTGTMMYSIGGAAIVVIAGILLVVSRKSRKKQDR